MSTLTAEERKKRQDEASSKMGQLLLQGWAMLEQTCPNCLVPIMRSRQKEEICVVCEHEYKMEKKITAEAKENSFASTTDTIDKTSQMETVPVIESCFQPQALENGQNNKDDSDLEYERMASDYEKTRGVKLPPRNKGSSMFTGRGTGLRPGGGFPRQPIKESAIIDESQQLVAQSQAQPQMFNQPTQNLRKEAPTSSFVTAPAISGPSPSGQSLAVVNSHDESACEPDPALYDVEALRMESIRGLGTQIRHINQMLLREPIGTLEQDDLARCISNLGQLHDLMKKLSEQK